MRNAKPSQVAAVVGALRAAKADGAKVKTAARDDTTQALPLSFATSVPDCTVVMWIAKDGVIDVWPAGGGAAEARRPRARRARHDARHRRRARACGPGCGAPAIVVGADDAMTWGLVFDLGTTVLGSPGRARAAAVLSRAPRRVTSSSLP